MPSLTLTEDQILELIWQLSPQRRQQLLFRARFQDPDMLEQGQKQMRQIASERGLDWDKMSDEERLYLVDDLVHEARAEEARNSADAGHA